MIATMNYLKIPRSLIYAHECGDKRVSCFSYFVLHSGLNKRVLFQCNYLITWCGFKPKRDKGCMNDKFKQVIAWMYENNFIQTADETIFHTKDFSRNSTLIANINPMAFFPVNNFGMVFDFEIDKIIEYSKEHRLHMDRRITHATLLLILAYIRCNIRSRPKESYDTQSEIERCPEVFYRMYTDIAKDLGLQERVVSNSIHILCDLQIIAKQEMPRFQDKNGAWHTDATMFVNRYKYIQEPVTKEPMSDNDYNYKRELTYSKKLLASKKYYVISTKKYESIKEE